jgi:pyruvate/2-oxoglutarate dehydrogenase complex dihydrolipoamide acyltransferase (E2) component
VSNHIGRTADYTVPQGEGWFEFDETPGTERLTFIMSKREIQEVTQITTGEAHAAPPAAAPAVPAPAPAPAPAPTPAPTATPQTEEQEILAALNSRSLSRGRDLKMVEDNTDSYVLASDETLAKPVGFQLTLQHH